MKKILSVCLLLLYCTVPSRATNITVSSFSITNSQISGTSAVMRIYFSRTFLDSNGITVIGGEMDSSSFYVKVTCTVVNPVITCPSFVLPSTTNSSTPSVRASAALYDANNLNRKAKLFENWMIPTSFGTSVTYQQLNTFNSARPAPLGDNYYTRNQVDTLIGAFINPTLKASDSIWGSVRLSYPALVTSDPIALGKNDPDIVRMGTPPIFTAGLTSLRNGIGSTSTDGLVLGNTSSAMAFIPQWSPRLRWQGASWLNFEGSTPIEFVGELKTDSTLNQGRLAFSASIDGSAYTEILSIFASPGGYMVGIRNSQPAALLHLGKAGTVGGTLAFDGLASGTVTVAPANAAGTWTFTLPAGPGSSGASLTTDGNGVTSWSVVAVTDAGLSTSDITTNNVSSSKHGFAPKSPGIASQFLNGAATPAWTPIASSNLSDAANIPLLNAANVFSNTTGQTVKKLLMLGAVSGTLTLIPPTVAGSGSWKFPGGVTDFSASGGANQFVRQSNAGGGLTVAALTSSDLPYKEYVATINQSGTGAPTLTEGINTTGATVTAARSGTGTYTLTFNSAVLTANKTFPFINFGGAAVTFVPSVGASVTSTTVVTVKTWDVNTASLRDDGLSSGTIRVVIVP